MVKNLMQKVKAYIKSGKSTGHMLNYLTLNIDQQEITQEIAQHSVNQKLSLFWAAILLSLLNTLAGLLSLI